MPAGMSTCAKGVLRGLIALGVVVAGGCATDGALPEWAVQTAALCTGDAGEGCGLPECTTSTQCDDGKWCTVSACVNGTCVSGKDPGKPGCCDAAGDCQDDDPCTLDTCNVAEHQCTFVDAGDPMCCNSHEDCDDIDDACSTLAFCGSANQCVYFAWAGKCDSDVDCDDANPTTVDTCKIDPVTKCGKCTHELAPGKCNEEADCPASTSCAEVDCVAGTCKTTPIDCCKEDVDALVACDDQNPCTIDYCLNQKCRHTMPKYGCCKTSADCFDGDKGSKDTCTNVDPTSGVGQCAWTLLADCMCTTELAYQGIACNDNNLCTIDSCDCTLCLHTPIAGCCETALDCDDVHPGTLDICLYNSCENVTTSTMCTAATVQQDCPAPAGACAKAACAGGQCVAAVAMPCTVPAEHCFDFTADAALDGWTLEPGWTQGNGAAFGGSRHLLRQAGPDVETCAWSPQIGVWTGVTLQAELVADDDELNVVAQLPGVGPPLAPVATWTKAGLHSAAVGALGPAVRFGLCAKGSVEAIAVDNVCLGKGNAPTAACPGPLSLPAGGQATASVAGQIATMGSAWWSTTPRPSWVVSKTPWNLPAAGQTGVTLFVAPPPGTAPGVVTVPVELHQGVLRSRCLVDIDVTP